MVPIVAGMGYREVMAEKPDISYPPPTERTEAQWRAYRANPPKNSLGARWQEAEDAFPAGITINGVPIAETEPQPPAGRPTSRPSSERT